MATVPTLKVPEQLPNVTPGVTATSAQFGGIEAKQLSGLATATGEVADVLKTVQDREDATAVLDAESKLKESTAKRQIEYQQRQGINASGLTKQAETDWNDAYKTFDSTLETPRQKELFRQRSLGTRAAHIESVSLHEAQQGKIANDNSAAASIKSSNDFAAANAANPVAVEQSRQDITRLSQYLSASRGDTPEMAALNLKAGLTTMHLGVLRNLADNEPTAARAYFTHYKEEIDGTQYDGVDKLLKTASRRVVAQAAGDEAIVKFGSEKDALAWARGKYKDGEDRAAVEMELKARFTEKDTLRKADESNAFDKAYKALENGARYSALPASLLNSLSGQGLEAIRKKADEPNGPAGTSWNRYYELLDVFKNDPTTFARIDLRQETKLRQEDRERLAEMQKGAGAKTPEYLKAATTEQMLSAAYNSLGIHDADKSDTTLQRKGALQNEVYRRINADQSTLKRELTASEKQAVIDETVIKGSVSRSWWFDKSAFAFELTPEELKTFTPDKLPSNLRAMITTAIQRSRGTSDPVTEQDITEAYRKLSERERQRLGLSNGGP